MHLYSTDRPDLGSGRKTLLIDGSVVPRVLVMPLEQGYELTIMLRCYDNTAVFAYSWHTTTIETMEALGEFFGMYRQDPEDTIRRYFAWEPRPWTSPRIRRPRLEAEPGGEAAAEATAELL